MKVDICRSFLFDGLRPDKDLAGWKLFEHRVHDQQTRHQIINGLKAEHRSRPCVGGRR